MVILYDAPCCQDGLRVTGVIGQAVAQIIEGHLGGEGGQGGLGEVAKC